MTREISYVKIKEILSRITRHPLLKDTTLEEVVQYVIDFIGINGMPRLYEDKEAVVEIKDYRGLLPCDCIAINQVKDMESGVCMRAMSSTFMPSDKEYPKFRERELSFKTQGNVIFTSMKNGEVLISYKSIKVDEDGYPMLIDNAKYLTALELFIKDKKFAILFDLGKINATVRKDTQQEYAWAAGRLHAEFTIPSVSEMETITRMWSTLTFNKTRFDNGFKDFNREHFKQH